MLWVHATLVEASLAVYQRFVRSCEGWCQTSSSVHSSIVPVAAATTRASASAPRSPAQLASARSSSACAAASCSPALAGASASSRGAASGSSR